MTHTLMKLPFANNALAPHISAETIEYHYGKHHQTYVTNLNHLLTGTGLEGMPLEELIVSGLERCPADKRTGIFNNAAQVFNHNFYWYTVTPGGATAPAGKLGTAIDETFGSFTNFKEKFTNTAVGTFGSGWAWLVKTRDGKLEILSTSNANTPIVEKKTPLITCDVWEHAYYIDYRNARPKYVEAYWNLVNWDFAAKNFG
ncbi:MAG: superoxide dismutase [bacterium]